jgi:hypothetical protein
MAGRGGDGPGLSHQERAAREKARKEARAARAALELRIRQTIDPRGVGGNEFVSYATKRALNSMNAIGLGDHGMDVQNTPARAEARAMASARASAAEITRAETAQNRKNTFGPQIKQPAARLAAVAAAARAGSLSRASLPGRQRLRIGGRRA